MNVQLLSKYLANALLDFRYGFYYWDEFTAGLGGGGEEVKGDTTVII